MSRQIVPVIWRLLTQVSLFSVLVLIWKVSFCIFSAILTFNVITKYSRYLTTFQKYYLTNAIPTVLSSFIFLQMREGMKDLEIFLIEKMLPWRSYSFGNQGGFSAVLDEKQFCNQSNVWRNTDFLISRKLKCWIFVVYREWQKESFKTH